MLKLGLLLVSLTLSLSACKTDVVYRERPVPVEVVKYRSPPVDASLLRGCPPVDTAGIETNGDLLAAIIAANTRLSACDAAQAQLRELLDGVE